MSTSEGDGTCCAVVGLILIAIIFGGVKFVEYVIGSEPLTAPVFYSEGQALVTEAGFHCPAVVCVRAAGITATGDDLYFVYCAETPDAWPNARLKFDVIETHRSGVASQRVTSSEWSLVPDLMRTIRCGPDDDEKAVN